jgi:hypothetical protein
MRWKAILKSSICAGVQFNFRGNITLCKYDLNFGALEQMVGPWTKLHKDSQGSLMGLSCLRPFGSLQCDNPAGYRSCCAAQAGRSFLFSRSLSHSFRSRNPRYLSFRRNVYRTSHVQKEHDSRVSHFQKEHRKHQKRKNTIQSVDQRRKNRWQLNF